MVELKDDELNMVNGGFRGCERFYGDVKKHNIDEYVGKELYFLKDTNKYMKALVVRVVEKPKRGWSCYIEISVTQLFGDAQNETQIRIGGEAEDWWAYEGMY